MKKISALFFTTWISVAMHAQPYTGGVEGKVRAGTEPLPYATVAIVNSPYGTITASEGIYEIHGVPPGLYTLEARMAGYHAQRVKIEIVDGQSTPINFDLREDILQLSQVVVTGTRSAIPAYRSPVIVNTISNRTFEATQSLTLSEGLRFTPGLRLENNCQNCGFTQLRMNGLEGPYSQILINSRPVFSALAGVYGLEMLPANMVERVEVVRGGGSALYGGNAIAGTVNIITKEPIENSFEVGMNQSFIDMSVPDRTITFNGQVVSDDLSKGMTLYGYNRTREPWDANGDDFSEVTQLRNTTIGFDGFWNTSERSKLKFGSYHIQEFRRGGNAFELPPHQSQLTEQLEHNIAGANLSFEQYSKNYKHKLSLYGSGQFVQRQSYYGAGGRILGPLDTLITEADILAINAYGRSRDHSLVGGLQYVYDINPQWMLTVGVEYTYNDVRDEMPGYGRFIDQQVGITGNYAQMQYKPAERWTILGGGRFDLLNIRGVYDLAEERFDNKEQFAVFVPRLSAMYDLTPKLKARASYAQGYRGPQAFDEDLHIETVGGSALFIRLDPDLEIERSESYTASLNYTEFAGKAQMNFVLEGFLTRLQNPYILSDQIGLDNGISTITKRNSDGARVRGLNLEANIALNNTWVIQAGLTLQQALFDVEEEIWAPEVGEELGLPVASTERILRTPNAYGFYTVTYKPNGRLQLSLSGIYTGRMDVPHVIDPDNEQTVIKSTPRFFEQNFKTSYRIYQSGTYRIEVFGGMANVFNSYQDDFDIGPERDAGYVYGPMLPRTIFGGIKLNLN